MDFENDTRTSIREELSNLTFEELLKLKQEIGSKAYNNALFGSKQTQYKKMQFKRENKNRPREMSSKKPERTVNNIITVKKAVYRDPRFDNLSGTFNKKAFEKSYSFINQIKEDEKRKMKRQMTAVEDEDERQKLKLSIQRLENQEREEKKLKLKEEQSRIDKEKVIEQLRQGRKPYFQKKSVKKTLELIQQYEQLKKSGKVQKHIEKKRKKLVSKDRKTLDFV